MAPENVIWKQLNKLQQMNEQWFVFMNTIELVIKDIIEGLDVD